MRADRISKRVCAFAVVTSLAVLAACGGDDDEESTGSADTAVAAATTTGSATTAGASSGASTTGGAPTSAAGATTSAGGATTAGAGAGTTANCDDGDAVKVGALFSLSGPAADIGAQAEEGARLAVEDVNASGGVLGRCLELILQDDGGDPTKAAQAARQLVDEDEVAWLVGPFLSSPIGTTIEVTTPAKVPQIIGGVLPDAGDATKYPYVFRTAVEASQQGKNFVDYILKSGYQRPAVLAVNNALGTSNLDALKASLEGTGIEVVAEEFHETGAVDLQPQVGALLDANPDVIMMFNTAGSDQIASVRALNSLGSTVPVLGFSSLAYANTAAELKKEAANNVYAGQAYRFLARAPGTNEPQGDKAKAFVNRLREARGEPTLTVGIEQQAGQYDSVRLIADTANRIGSLDGDDLREALEADGFEGVRANYLFTADRHDGVPLEQLAFVVPTTFEGGIIDLAPNQ